ncbi:F-box domain [Arabidopsis suecica]|uniref:F-box domain n=1 Tax=Arabidopsis suecica TaxID=45249 RepID=A0A8T1ZES6_ARASU|nr:F-box domain [Arabidopsis suecica]
MSSSSSSPLPPAMKNGESRNWTELPPELTSSILHRLGAIEILLNAQRVCRSWRRICKDPSMWRKIDIKIPRKFEDLFHDLEAVYRRAVDLSQGGLIEINIEHLTNTSLLNYIADRSSNLRRLGVVDCGPVMSSGVVEAVMKLPLLEEVEITYESSIREQDLKVVGQSCPNLRTLKLNCIGDFKCCDKVALAIAETMPGLRHLRLSRNGLSDTGLNAILEGCPHLENLELHKCLNINLVGDMGK